MKEFTIPVRPQPKQRPRKGKYGNIYTPNETQEYEALVKMYAERAGIEMTTKPVGVEGICYFKDKRTPDLDNCTKAILDGLQGVAYKNDKQVVEQHFLLDYDDNERAEVKIWEVEKGSLWVLNRMLWRVLRYFIKMCGDQEWMN